MKNEDLYVYKKSDFYEDFISSQKEYYEREQVDTLLAEKDREIALLKERICNGDVSRATWIDDCIAKDKEIAELKQKLEDVQASAYAESVDAGMRERRLHRELYKACANWAHFAVAFFSSYATKEKWHKMDRKCLNKMEEYK